MNEYYEKNARRFLEQFDQESYYWLTALITLHEPEISGNVREMLLASFEAFLPSIPYIGGDDNRRTLSILDAARCLVFYQLFKGRLSVEEIGQVLFEAIKLRQTDRTPAFYRDQKYTPEQVKEYRIRQAKQSQEKRYNADYVYEYVSPDSGEFEHGCNFTECGAFKLYKEYSALEFLPYYCYLDFPKMINTGQKMIRDNAMSLGDSFCNHRFKKGDQGEIPWPPPFVQNTDKTKGDQ